MDQATEIYSHEFDANFRGLPPHLQQRIEAKISELELVTLGHRREIYRG